MADLTSIIAGVDGMRNYESNRALSLSNQAQNMQNEQMSAIMRLKNELAGLQNNPYAKWGIYDPQGRQQQLMNEDKQLQIASKWANSIKNLAPEKRAQGYAQFLRAMPTLGIDVSDMPQGYDEAYINQLADLGIETETRYQNEQANARQERQIAATQANLERQIAANREARQDEFEKRLAAYDYKNNALTKAQKDKIAEADEYINGLGLDEDLTKRLMARNHGIELPSAEDVMLGRLRDNINDREAAQWLLNNLQLKKMMNVPNAKDISGTLSSISTAVKNGMSSETGKTLAKELTNYDVDFDKDGGITLKDAGDLAQKSGISYTPESVQEALRTNDVTKLVAAPKVFTPSAEMQSFNQMVKDGVSQEEAYVRSGLDKVGSQDAINQNLSNLRKAEADHQNLLNMNLEQYRKTLPTDKMREIQEESEVTGTPIKEIIEQNKELEETQKRMDILNKQAQIRKNMVNAAKTAAEIPYVGKTNEMKNAQYLQENPDMADSPAFKKAETMVNIDNKTEAKEAQERATQKVKAENDYRVALSMRNEALPRIDSIIEDITKNPNTVGAFSSWKEELNKYTGRNSEWQKIRGNVVRKIKTVANDLIAKAKQSGTSGINTVAEINFIVGNVSPDASPETLIGALEALKEETESFTAKTWNYYQSFNNPLQTYTPYSVDGQAYEEGVSEPTGYDFSNVADENLF